MVKKILTDAGFIEGTTYKESRFLASPRSGSYAVYNDEYEARGSDDHIFIREHTYTIELYCGIPDPDAEERIASAISAAGIQFEKQERYWIQEEQLYQTVFTFDYIEKL